MLFLTLVSLASAAKASSVLGNTTTTTDPGPGSSTQSGYPNDVSPNHDSEATTTSLDADSVFGGVMDSMAESDPFRSDAKTGDDGKSTDAISTDPFRSDAKSDDDAKTTDAISNFFENEAEPAKNTTTSLPSTLQLTETLRYTTDDTTQLNIQNRPDNENITVHLESLAQLTNITSTTPAVVTTNATNDSASESNDTTIQINSSTSNPPFNTTATNDTNDSNLPLLLIVAFDGFRYDFINESITPNLYELAQKGAWAVNGIRPAFATETTSCFTTMSTGLYPENSGILANVMVNGSTGHYVFDYFNFKYKVPVKQSKDPKWFHGVPFWKVNEKAGTGRRSGMFLWPTSDIRYNNEKGPFRHHPLDFLRTETEQWKKDLNTVLQWFEDKSTPINLGAYYMNEPDHTQHPVAMESDTAARKVTEIDRFIGYLFERVQNSSKLKDRLNLIFLSDHGMTTFRKSTLVYMEKFLGNTSHEISNEAYPTLAPSPYLGYQPDLNWEDIYQKLKNHEKDGHFKMYRKSEIPESLHIRKHFGIHKMIMLMEPGYYPIFTKSRPFYVGDVGSYHGWYSNDVPEMRPMFLAYGPKIKQGHRKTDVVDSVNIYQLICDILDVQAPQTDGTGGLQDFLRDSSSATGNGLSQYQRAFAWIASVGLVATLAVCVAYSVL